MSITLCLITIPFLLAIENYVLRIAVGWEKGYNEDRISLDRVYYAVLCYVIIPRIYKSAISLPGERRQRGEN